MTSVDLHTAVKNSYPTPNFVYLQEVRDATGFDSVRSADALALGMYRSCGRLIHGFEMKVSRSDWLRELKDASKAESIMRFCHHWSVIVPDVSIVHDGELPPTWGLGVPVVSRKGAAPKVKWIVKPPLLEPMAPSMVFLSALIYAAQKVDANLQKKQLAAQYADGVKAGKAQADRKEGSDKLRAAVDAFEAASGVTLNHYTSVDAATRQGLSFQKWLRAESDHEYHRRALVQLKEQAERTLHGIVSAIKPLEERVETTSTL